MISYVNLGTNNLATAKQFYGDLLAEIGAVMLYETDRAGFFSLPDGGPMIAICTPFDQQPATFGNGTMIALNAGSTDIVDQMHAKALTMGGSNEGDPGFRIPGVLYIGYVRDLDGNKLAFAHRVS